MKTTQKTVLHTISVLVVRMHTVFTICVRSLNIYTHITLFVVKSYKILTFFVDMESLFALLSGSFSLLRLAIVYAECLCNFSSKYANCLIHKQHTITELTQHNNTMHTRTESVVMVMYNFLLLLPPIIAVCDCGYQHGGGSG